MEETTLADVVAAVDAAKLVIDETLYFVKCVAIAVGLHLGFMLWRLTVLAKNQRNVW